MKEPAQQTLFPEEELVSYKITHVVKRDGRIVAFNKDKITDSIFRAAVEVGGQNRELSEELAYKVVELINQTYPVGSTPTVEEIQDLTEKVLVENGHFKTAKAYILYRQEHKRLREGKESRIVVEDNIPYKILWRVFTWNIDHECETTEKLNKRLSDGTFQKLVEDAERQYHEEIEKVAAEIIARRDKIRIIIVAGPSSSGKTTTTIKITETLSNAGIKLLPLNLDNYFKNLDEHPKDEYGDYDFETPQALDLNLINEHLFQLVQGKTIKMPVYDFKTGKRSSESKEVTLKPNQILIIDSLHGLFSEMTASIPHDLKFKFYIEALCQLRDSHGEFMRWADLRMLRRMVRDSWHRSYDPKRTVGHWHYVRRSEMKYIVPYINKVDYIFNGALPYELPVHKKYLYKYFPEILKMYESDSKKVDAYIRAKRVYNLLSEVDELQDDSIIPKNSLLREFIGGSCYNY
ncbi:MAG: ATP cone domain-containing protein [Elusimicrobiota bacterium]|nr:ATP cone domain-containing protein [Elusimicrobiota bacterium]